MEIMIIMLRKEKQHGQEFDVMHTHEHCFLQLNSQSRDCTQIRAWRSNMLLRLMQLQQTTQDVDSVAAQSAISSQGVAQKLLLLVAIRTSSFWSPSFFLSTISYSHMKPFHWLLSMEGQKLFVPRRDESRKQHVKLSRLHCRIASSGGKAEWAR